jgi:hypothetical protein
MWRLVIAVDLFVSALACSGGLISLGLPSCFLSCNIS